MKYKPAIVWNPKGVPSHVDSFSPSWKKPKKFVEYITQTADLWGVQFIESPTAKADLIRVHSKFYVDGVMSGRIRNGFGGKSEWVADSCGYTCGAMVKAMQLAKEGYSCCAPVSGFHHAGFDFGGGFCTFNGLALAAVMAYEDFMFPGIIDLDMHKSNGTMDILDLLDLKYDIPLFSYGGSGLDRRNTGQLFLATLPHILEDNFSDCGVLLFQAGMDPFVDDPLGGCLTEDELKSRDNIVFGFARKHGIPVVWNLAGGYTTPLSTVLELHENTFNIWLDSLA